MTKEEAIKLVKERVWLESGRPVSDALEMLIPELGESDDERVRKGLINFLQSPFIKENLTDEKVAPWIAYLEQQKEQKLIEWSEEDETHRAFILELLEDYIRFCKKDAEGAYYTKQIRTAQNWLKSLRPPQDRCEDCPHRGDMFLLTQGIKSGKHNLAVTFMNYMDENRTEDKTGLSNSECEDIDKAFEENDWNKIIRYIEKYKPHWKPNEEQMKALLNIEGDLRAFQHNDKAKIIAELYEQLKKLM